MSGYWFFKQQTCTSVDIKPGGWRRCNLTERKVGNRVKSGDAGMNLFSWLISLGYAVSCMESWFSHCTFLSKFLITQDTDVTRGFVGKVFKRLRKFKHAAIGKPCSDESDEKTFCCSSISWLLGFITFWGSKKLLKLSRFSMGDICVLAKPVPGAEKAGKVLAHYCPGLCPVPRGSTKGTPGFFVPLCHIGMKFRDSALNSVGRKLGLKGWGRAMRDWDVFLPLEGGRMTSLLIKTTFVEEALSYPSFSSAFP